ncbi:MAG: efflux RND transporter periplasmic adaptor subunit [Rhizobiaceae bacterium]
MDQIVERPTKRPDSDRQSIDDVLAIGGTRARRRRWPLVLFLVLTLAATAGAYSWYSQPQAVPAYETVEIGSGAMTVMVSATGTLEPLTRVEISSELSGVVRSVAVAENQPVETGQVLAQLDTTRIEAQVERAEAGVAVAAARVTEARATFNETERALTRARQLSERGMVADQALDNALAAHERSQSAVEVAEANLAIARADLRLQEADLANATIYSPIDGIVLERAVNPGQTVAASTSAPILFVIAENLERMELKAAIDEADIGEVAAGQTARFAVDAFPARRFDAEIRDISFASLVTEGVVTYEARLAVDNADLVLRPGMTATVDIVTREADDVLLVPAAALRFTPPQTGPAQSGFSLANLFSPQRMSGMRGGGRGPAGAGGRQRGGEGTRTLWLLQDGQPRPARVTTGATSGDQIEILSGLNPGDRVITGVAQR